MATKTTAFLATLTPAAPDANKTRIVQQLMATKGYDPQDVKLLGFEKDGKFNFYFFQVPGAVVEIEIYWDTAQGRYERRFSDVMDDPAEVEQMLGFIPTSIWGTSSS